MLISHNINLNKIRGSQKGSVILLSIEPIRFAFIKDQIFKILKCTKNPIHFFQNAKYLSNNKYYEDQFITCSRNTKQIGMLINTFTASSAGRNPRFSECFKNSIT